VVDVAEGGMVLGGGQGEVVGGDFGAL